MEINIRDLGAKENSELQTQIIQEAIDKVFLAGGGKVIIPKGRFRTGGFRLRSNITLYLEKGAVLEGSRDPEDYFNHFNDKLEPFPEELLTKEPRVSNKGQLLNYEKHGGRWYNALIRAYKAENIKIIGEEGSQIDGMDCYDEFGEEAYRGPHATCFIKCNNLYLSGYEIINSSNWAHSLWYCNNIELDKVTVTAGHDGCHMRYCRNVYIHDCTFNTGDDCVAGYNIWNISVKNCEMNTACSAFRLGPTNALIENVHAYGPPKCLKRGTLSLEDKKAGVHEVPKDREWDFMLNFWTYASVKYYTTENPGNENIIFRNCTIENVDRFIQYNFSGNSPWQSGCPLLDVKFENLTAKNIKYPLTIYADKDKHIKFRMENVDVSIRKGYEHLHFMDAANFDLIELKNVNVKNSNANVLIKKWTDDDNIVLENVTYSDNFAVSEKQEQAFDITPI